MSMCKKGLRSPYNLIISHLSAYLGNLSKELPCIYKHMLLRLQRYNLRVIYTKTDTLSRAYLPLNMCDLKPSLEEIDATLGLLVSADRLQQIQHATLENPALPLLSDVIKVGWPNDKRSLPPAILPYWDAHNELVIGCSLIFIGH